MAYGPIRAAYQDRNRDALDKLIASHALALGVTLVTNNETDFVSYAGLQMDNWVNSHRGGMEDPTAMPFATS